MLNSEIPHSFKSNTTSFLPFPPWGSQSSLVSPKIKLLGEGVGGEVVAHHLFLFSPVSGKTQCWVNHQNKMQKLFTVPTWNLSHLRKGNVIPAHSCSSWDLHHQHRFYFQKSHQRQGAETAKVRYCH